MQTKGADLQLPPSVTNQNVHNKKGKARAPRATIKEAESHFLCAQLPTIRVCVVRGGVVMSGKQVQEREEREYLMSNYA